MNTFRFHILAILTAVCALVTWDAPSPPYIGYVYPAGGQQGTVVHVTVGGQHIKEVRDINISGAGLSATFVGYVGAGGPLNGAQRELLRQRIQELIARQTPASPGQKNTPAVPPAVTPAVPANLPTTSANPLAPANSPVITATLPTPPATPPTGQGNPPTPAASAPAIASTPEVTLPDLPDLRNLDQLSIKQLRQLSQKYLNTQNRPKPPIAEEATLEVTIAPDSAPGDRELRFITPGGLSNPLIFQVGSISEERENDPADDDASALSPVAAPVVLNGRIMPGAVDRYPLTLRGGQQLVISAQARHLVPYLADAVPGWCQAALALDDAEGKEIAYADDNSFDPDPYFHVQVPRDGIYQLTVRDALYRGREDFVYRVSVCEQTPGQSCFPFAKPGRVSPDVVPNGVNPQLPFVDSRIPQCDAQEPQNTVNTAQPIALPILINGRIGQPGDIAKFKFMGKAGDAVVAEIYARRLGSPLDSLLRVSDAKGHVIAWNDDYEHGEMGLITHQADSYLSVKLPADGVYFVQVADAQHHGGDAYNYYLRVGPPQADFALRATPSGVNVPAGGGSPITVYAFRKDGWNGDIEVTLKDAPAGFALKDARIPAGQDHAVITLTAPRQRSEQPIALQLEGRAVIGGQTVIRPIVPADRKMQAFAYYHLVPAQQLMVMVTRR